MCQSINHQGHCLYVTYLIKWTVTSVKQKWCNDTNHCHKPIKQTVPITYSWNELHLCVKIHIPNLSVFFILNLKMRYIF